MPVAGQRVLAGDFPAAVADLLSTSGTTTSATYVETLTGGTAAAVTFIAPTSGRVEISIAAQIDTTGASIAYMSAVVRTGGVIGSGSVVSAAADDKALAAATAGATDAGVHQATRDIFVSGLTAGATYNVRQAFRAVGGTTATFSNKSLYVKPLP